MKYSLLLLLIFSLAVGVSIVVGYRQPVSPMMRELRLTECTPPCWLGITSGQSTLANAFQRLQQHQAGVKPQAEPIGMTGRVFTFFPEMDSERTVEFEATNGLIDAIVLPGDYGNRTELDIPMPSVGDMLVWLGGPSCIQPQGHYSGQDFVFNSESATLTITLRGNALVPTQPIYRLSSQPYNTVANPCREATTTRWRGFVSVDR